MNDAEKVVAELIEVVRDGREAEKTLARIRQMLGVQEGNFPQRKRSRGRRLTDSEFSRITGAFEGVDLTKNIGPIVEELHIETGISHSKIYDVVNRSFGRVSKMRLGYAASGAKFADVGRA